MRGVTPAAFVVSLLPSSIQHRSDGGMIGDLPLHILMADEVMVTVLRSAGHTAASFMQQWRGFTAVRQAAAA